MAKYFVEVVMATCVTIEVNAHDEKDAQELAIEEADPYMGMVWSYDINCVYREDEEAEE